MIARWEQLSTAEVVSPTVVDLEKQDYLHGLVADYERLREDPERWNQYVAGTST